MAFWKRSKAEHELARRAFAAERIIGSLPCSETFCERHDAALCAYMDPRGHRCRSAVCAEHQEVVSGQCYCHLHGETLRAVGMVAGDSHLPEVDNPGPSLVAWIARDLHDRVVELLQGAIDGSPTEHVVVDEVVTPIRAADGSRRWEQAWKIVDHTGISQKVTVLVQESAPAEVVVRVNGRVVFSGVPPWFQGFQQGPRVSSEDAAAERAALYEPIHAGIADAVRAERTAGVRGPY